MFERSWRRASSWLRKRNRERIGNVVVIVIVYSALAFIGGVASILWGIV